MSDKSKKYKNKETSDNWEIKAKEYLDGWQRAKADYLNLKKETEDERQKAMFYSKILILAELLPIISNLQKATNALEQTDEAKKNNWAMGFIHLAKQFDGFLTDTGVARIKTKGEVFDPSFHEAIEREEKKGVESDTIIREVEPGYTLYDSVIAPAKVIVAK